MTPDRGKRRIVTRRIVHYTGDPLEISLRFWRGSRFVRQGDVDAYVVIFTPDLEEEAIVVPVSNEASIAGEHRLFRIDQVDVSALPVGWYQMGLVLTEPGGNPLDLNQWHNGLRGLLQTIGIVVTDEWVGYDKDGDGNVDDDTNGDGFSDSDAANPSDNSSDSSSGS